MKKALASAGAFIRVSYPFNPFAAGQGAFDYDLFTEAPFIGGALLRLTNIRKYPQSCIFHFPFA